MPFPPDDYTPHGYLDSPAHTRNLTPRGVVRSWEAGFRWHYPAHAGMYGGSQETYRAGLRVGLGGAVALGDFDAASSPYHSKDIVAFDIRRGDANAHVEYQLVGEHALHATIRTPQLSHVTIHVEYARLLSAHGERPLAITIEPLDAERATVLVGERREEIAWGAELAIAAAE